MFIKIAFIYKDYAFMHGFPLSRHYPRVVQIHSWNAHSKNAGIPRMDLDTEEIREMHNLYVENTHGSLKNIIAFKEKNMNLYINVCDVCEY